MDKRVSMSILGIPIRWQDIIIKNIEIKANHEMLPYEKNGKAGENLNSISC